MNYKNNLNTPDELILTITDIVNLLKNGKLISHNLNIYFNPKKKFTGLDAEDKIEMMKKFKTSNAIKLIEIVELRLKDKNT
jgi:hypothetical protein